LNAKLTNGTKVLAKEEKTPRMNRILVVDDASFMRLMICHILARKHLTDTMEAENGQQAIELFKSFRPTLTIMDITMPELDGLSALDEILRIDPSAKVIMCSAVAHETMVLEALKRGAVDFVSKPFRPDELFRIVTKHLN
jgi:two-component system, chemotaxis family, chemotaxis protein CheY